jgi:hypothetical protein
MYTPPSQHNCNTTTTVTTPQRDSTTTMTALHTRCEARNLQGPYKFPAISAVVLVIFSGTYSTGVTNTLAAGSASACRGIGWQYTISLSLSMGFFLQARKYVHH